MTRQERRRKRLRVLLGETALPPAELGERLVGLTYAEGSRLAELSGYVLADTPTSGWWAGPARRDRIWVTTAGPAGVIAEVRFDA